MIGVNGLSYSYDKNRKVLKDISFSVEKGEIFGFLGPNGAGKSTTQKIITGIVGGYEGNINVAGYDLSEVKKEFYQKIGVLFEMPYLYSTLSAVDNLKYFSSFYDKAQLRNNEELLELVQLKNNYKKKQVKEYSKGMKQRTSFARVLLHSPQILFLDEPISGLDPAGAVLIKDIIREEKAKGTTIFLTTHNMYVAEELCDRVAFIVDGEIKAIDTPRSFKTNCVEKQVIVEYVQDGERRIRTINIEDVKRGLSFKCDSIISIHSKELTMEDVFINITGRGLA